MHRQKRKGFAVHYNSRSPVYIHWRRAHCDRTGSNLYGLQNRKALLTIKIRPGYKTDGASTFFPISLLVPQWVPGDDNYNAAPVAHDVLYMLGGIVDGVHEPVKLSREEVDDILRGVWRCWGMSRFVAACADKGVEIFAGGKQHWKNDSYGVRQFVDVKWEVAACSR
jgi:hypothetical protein